MLHKISEKKMHVLRWVLAIGWIVLILSMFYDPITTRFTEPDAWGPFRLNPDIYLDPARCVQIHSKCIPEQPFSLTVLMWWAMIVPAGIFILFVFGHEFWRRICPLSFFSQIPRALGIQRKRKVYDPVSQQTRYEVVTIGEKSWLGRNHLYVQAGLFFLGLGLRILFVNGHRASLGFFLIFTILCAIGVGYLFAGKSWCNYFCPMAPVQTIYTGPRSLLGSRAHVDVMQNGVSQSMCRTVDQTGLEVPACVSCKSPCIDIDAEKTYWAELNKPGRTLVHYGYLGMVISFYVYYYLFSGNWDYYFSGAWTHEETLLEKLFAPGFYINGYLIFIPKVIAVFLTYFVFAGSTYWLGLLCEKLYRRYKTWRGTPVTAEYARHIIFTLFTTVSFWTFFSYGARPTLNRLPYPLVLGFNAVVVFVGALWLYRTLRRGREQYDRERQANSLRKQLKKMNISAERLGRTSLDDLNPDEVVALAKVVPQFAQESRIYTYAEVIEDLLEQKAITVEGSFRFFAKLRQELKISDDDHYAAIDMIAQRNSSLIMQDLVKPTTSDHLTIASPVRRAIRQDNTLPFRQKVQPSEEQGRTLPHAVRQRKG
jgi:hypothetical protein